MCDAISVQIRVLFGEEAEGCDGLSDIGFEYHRVQGDSDDMANPQLIEQIENAFTYHPPTGNQPETYHNIRGQAKSLAQTLVNECPAGRELSLALTNLEQAVMWGNAAIARSGGGGARTGGAGGGSG